MAGWLYETFMSGLVVTLVLDPLRVLQIDIAAGQAERGAKRQTSRSGTTFLAAGAIILFVSIIRPVLRIGVQEMRLVSAGLLVIMQLRHMFSETARNRELPAARYAAELHPQMLAAVPVLIAFVFIASWYGYAANLAGLGMAGLVMLLARRCLPARRLSGIIARYYRGLSWLEQFAVLTLASQSLVNVFRTLAQAG